MNSDLVGICNEFRHHVRNCPRCSFAVRYEQDTDWDHFTLSIKANLRTKPRWCPTARDVLLRIFDLRREPEPRPPKQPKQPNEDTHKPENDAPNQVQQPDNGSDATVSDMAIQPQPQDQKGEQ